MRNIKTTPITEKDIQILSELCLDIEDLEERASRCDSLVDIFAEALESMHEKGTQPIDGATYSRIAEIIREYSMAVKSGTENIHNKLLVLKDNLKNDKDNGE